MRQPRHRIATDIAPEAYNALKEVSERNRVGVSAYVNAIILDALVDEGYTNIDIQCVRAQRRTPS